MHKFNWPDSRFSYVISITFSFLFLICAYANNFMHHILSCVIRFWNSVKQFFSDFLEKWWEALGPFADFHLVNSGWLHIQFLHITGRFPRKNVAQRKQQWPWRKRTGKMPPARCAWSTHIMLFCCYALLMTRAADPTCAGPAIGTQIALINLRRHTQKCHPPITIQWLTLDQICLTPLHARSLRLWSLHVLCAEGR